MDVPECPGCRERDARIAEHEARIAVLEEEIRRLKDLLGRNASNSSVPPSANPLSAPAPVIKKKSGRRPGGQPDHPPHLKQLLPPERVNHTIVVVPDECSHCQTPLPQVAGAKDLPPSRHQIVELPVIRATVTEYQAHARTCPCCGAINWATLPAEIRQHSIGPGLAAHMAYLAGCHQVGKRGIEEIIETLFEVPVSLGTVSNLEQEMSQALAPAHAEAVQAVQQAAVKHIDETGWKKHGRKCWLWVAATAQVAAFVVHVGRGLAAMTLLLGETIHGIVISDRWSVYKRLPEYQRQLCWAHLKRDFQALVDRGGKAKPYGEELLAITGEVFGWWKRVRDGTLSRASLQRYIQCPRVRLWHVLWRGQACGCAKTEAFCKQLLEWEAALWTFTRREGVEPTNNRAERALRKGVLWRKRSFGCASEAGCRFVERILTVVQSLRQQGRQVWQFLRDSLQAHRTRAVRPKLCVG